MRSPSKCKNPSHTNFSLVLIISNQGFVNQNARSAGQLSRGCSERGAKQGRGKVNLTSFKYVAWYSTSIQDPKNCPPKTNQQSQIQFVLPRVERKNKEIWYLLDLIKELMFCSLKKQEGRRQNQQLWYFFNFSMSSSVSHLLQAFITICSILISRTITPLKSRSAGRYK